MRKWEEKYEKLKNGEFDARIDELKQKVDEKKATREEYAEYQKLSVAKGNVGKVQNIIEYREKLKSILEDIKKENQEREALKKANEEREKIEEELKGIQEELKSITVQLKDKSLTPEKRAQLEAKKAELKGKRDDNTKKYLANQEALKTGLSRTGKYKDYDEKDLENLKFETSSKISKCNMVANSLVSGLSWDSIDLKLDNWAKDRKLTPKDEKSKDPIEAARRAREAKVKGFKLDPDIDKEFEDEPKEPKSDKPEHEEGGKLDRTFADKHPRLARIGNFFKGIRDKIMRNEKDEVHNTETKKPVRKEEPEVTEKAKNEGREVVDLGFKEYIKVVAEKGYEVADADLEAARKEELKARLKAFRQENGYGPKPGEETKLTPEGREALRRIDEQVRRIKEEQDGPEL